MMRSLAGGLPDQQQHHKSIARLGTDRTPNRDAAVHWRAAGYVYSDLWRACLHEHAHAAVARHFDVLSDVRIERNPDGGPEQRHYVGQCRMYSRPEGMPGRIVGLAGTVAECVDEDNDVESWDVAEYLLLELITLSNTDADLASGYSDADIALCLQLVRRMWPEIVSMATRQFEIEQVYTG
jgi:hypothetical protein